MQLEQDMMKKKFMNSQGFMVSHIPLNHAKPKTPIHLANQMQTAAGTDSYSQYGLKSIASASNAATKIKIAATLGAKDKAKTLT